MSPNLFVQYFKCFNRMSLRLGKLNVFCGRNGTGKSSAIQAILLHHVAIIQMIKGVSEVPLNGKPGLSLGTIIDVLHRGTLPEKRDGTIKIGFNPSAIRNILEFEIPKSGDDENYLLVSKKKGGARGDIRLDRPWHFVYLSAERLGPRRSQERMSDEPDSSLTLGEHGEHTAEVFHRFERRKIRPTIIHPDEQKKPREERNYYLARNIELWMSEIFGQLQIRVDSNGRNAPPTISVRDAKGHSDWVTCTNYGFGVSYCLPIVVAGLLCEPGGTLIIDSPEAHLHPAAQTEIAKFLAWIAASGCTVIVETHSDHIVDGIRLAVVARDIPLTNKDCNFINFDKSENGASLVDQIRVLPDGTLERWPRGFFDQQSINLRNLSQSSRQ